MFKVTQTFPDTGGWGSMECGTLEEAQNWFNTKAELLVSYARVLQLLDPEGNVLQEVANIPM